MSSTGQAHIAQRADTDSMVGAGLSWTGSYSAMLHWHLMDLRLWLPMMAVVQVLTGVGFILGIGLLFESFPPRSALFVSTGAPAINLMMVGLVFGPQLVADQRLDGSYDYLRTMPTKDSASAAAWYTVCLLGGVPAMVVSLITGWIYHDLQLEVSAVIIPAVVASSLAATMVGFAISHAIISPMTSKLVTQLLVLMVFGFTPILFPAEQLPAWLAAVNGWLPFQHMATVLRAAVTHNDGAQPIVAYLILAAWTVGCGFISARALRRRP